MARQAKHTDVFSVWQQAAQEGDDGMRRLVERVVQEVLETEITRFLQAEPYERTRERRGYRNGYKPRLLKTRVGTLELLVPKDREGQFQTELFERYQRSEKALLLAIMQMYLEGVSTRKVRAITEELCGLEISKSQVSALSQQLDEEIQRWRERPLERSYPYLVVDARYEKVRRGGQVVSQGVLLVVGISPEGYREILGVWVADSENETSWSEVFAELSRRGLQGVRYVVSDAHQGLRRALERHFQGALWQRCQVHLIRNVLNLASRKDRGAVLEQLRSITEAPTLEAAREALGRAVAVLEKKHPKVAAFLEDQGEETLAVYELPSEHRRRMRSTNLLERLNQEIKRRTRVIRIFPNEAACLRLISALAMETNLEWMERVYLKMDETTVSEEEMVEVA
ncbi:MAG: IS256 family transposase [Acidobacteriia bacterium]|nr:IS256 family transposase [Terriglobia bacterium]